MFDTHQTTAILPDFCAGERVVHSLLLCEAVAVVLALGLPQSGRFWEQLFLLSVYVQWIGVISAAALCQLRRHAGNLSTRLVMSLAYVVLLATTFVVTLILVYAGHFAGFGLLVEHDEQWVFVARSVAICAVVAALGLRYFWLRASWIVQAEAEARARLDALQARIEPHFLFNTLNSVAALIEVRPDDAETALEDLSELLHVRLRTEGPSLITLADELRLVTAYLRIEQLRLGGRLQVEFDVPDATRACRLPALSLQPLVENAVGHGIARLAVGGTVRVRARLARKILQLEVRNPAVTDAKDTSGNHRALVNIRRRLALAYAGAARLEFVHDDTWFTVFLRLPQEREDN